MGLTALITYSLGRQDAPAPRSPPTIAAPAPSLVKPVALTDTQRDAISAVRFLDGTVYAFHDITEAHRLDQLQAEFTATASHELRTPLAAVYGAAECWREVRGALHRLAMPAEGARVRGEIGIAQLGAVDAAGVLALLVHADRAVEPVVDHQRDEIGAVLRRSRDLLPGYQEVAVATEREHRALGRGKLRRLRS